MENFTAFYTRVSTDKQDSSLETQAEMAGQYARLNNLIFEDAVCCSDPDTSGSIPFLERDGGRLLVNTLKLYPQVKHLIVTKLDRLGRNTIDVMNTLNLFRSLGISVHILNLGGNMVNTETPLGQFFITVVAAFAQLERDTIRERITDKMTVARRKGLQTGTIPYGKRAVEIPGELNKQGKPLCRLEDDPHEQHWLRQIWAWRHELKWSFHRIARELNSLGVPTKTPRGTMICIGKDPISKERIEQPSSGLWQPGNIKHVLENRYTLEQMREA